MFEQREEDLIRLWQDTLPGDVRIRAVVTGGQAGERIRAFAERLGTLAPRVRVSVELASGTGRPAILVGQRLHYLAAPLGTELAPFLEAVHRFGAAEAADDAGLGSGPGTPGHDVRVYVSLHCPHCPVAVRTLVALLGDDPSVMLTVIDAELFAEMAAADRVRSVPTVVAGRYYRSTGTVSIDELRAAVAGLAPDGTALARMLDGGDAEAVAGMMVDRGEVFPAVLDRIAHDTMTVRLGAMAAMERLIEQSPDVARSAEAGLWERVAGASREATGDLLYVIGESGTSASVPWLEAFHETTLDEDLKEAVTDALARIAERTGT
jgi:hypothetical protein